MPIKFGYDPKPTLKAVFWGQEGRGKTHGMCSLVAMACKLGVVKQGGILCIATESWVDDWYKRLSSATGREIAVEKTRDPAKALEIFKEAERPDSGISIVLIDCMAELQSEPRRAFVTRTGKPMGVQHYSTVDAPYNAFVEHLRHSKLHWVATAREKDDRQAVDGDNEIVIGKTASAKIGEVARLKVHCQRGRAKGGETQFDWHVLDTGSNEVMRYLGRPSSSIWEPHLRRFMSESTPTTAKSAGAGRASRDKGARFELELLRFLKDRRYAAIRSRQFKIGGAGDPDVLAVYFAGGKPLKIEAKNRKNMPSKTHLAALAQAEAAGEGIPIAVSKVARRPITEAVVTMRFGDLLDLYEGLACRQAAALSAAIDVAMRQEST